MNARHISPAEHAAEIFARAVTQGGDRGLAERAEQILAITRASNATMDIFQSLLMTLVYCGQLEQAAAWCDRVLENDRLFPAWRAAFETIRGEIALREGASEQARGHTMTALDLISADEWGVGLAAPLACLVLACTALGRHDEAEDLLHRPVPQASFQTRYGLHYLHARGHHNLVVGSLDAAFADFRTCGLLMADWGLNNAEVVPWRTDAALVHLRRGAAKEARAFAEAQLRLSPDDAVAGEIREQAIGQSPKALIRTLPVLHRACGGALPRALLGADGPGKGGARLSNAELRVARLVVSGQTNREIAANLSLTLSTVEQHLTNILRKLGIRSRTQVDARLRHLSALKPD